MTPVPSNSDVPLTDRAFWLTGVLIIIVLFLLFLVAILLVRYLWRRRCLSLYYYGGAEGSCSFLAQYLFRLTLDRKPSGHHKGCQVWADVVYEKEDALTIPLNLTKVHMKPSAFCIKSNFLFFKLAAASLEAEAHLTGACPHKPASLKHSYGNAQARVCI